MNFHLRSCSAFKACYSPNNCCRITGNSWIIVFSLATYALPTTELGKIGFALATLNSCIIGWFCLIPGRFTKQALHCCLKVTSPAQRTQTVTPQQVKINASLSQNISEHVSQTHSSQVFGNITLWEVNRARGSSCLASVGSGSIRGCTLLVDG